MSYHSSMGLLMARPPSTEGCERVIGLQPTQPSEQTQPDKVLCTRCQWTIAYRVPGSPHMVEAMYKGGARHWPSLPWPVECPRCKAPQVVR